MARISIRALVILVLAGCGDGTGAAAKDGGAQIGDARAAAPTDGASPGQDAAIPDAPAKDVPAAIPDAPTGADRQVAADAGGQDVAALPDAVSADMRPAQPDAGGADTVTGTSPSGEAMPAGDLPGWRLIFSDDFLTDVPLGSFPKAVATKWDAYGSGWSDTSKNGAYWPTKVISVSGGMMNLFIHTEGGVHMVSAPMPKLPAGETTGGGSGRLYGRYAIRFRSDPVPGYKTAWLLWPDSEVWPRDGEINLPEGDLDSTISAFMHRQNGASGSDQDAYSSKTTYTAWHTAIIEWTATHCRFILDAVTIGDSTSRIPNTPMHWVIQTETQLSGGAPADSAQGNLQIDWVAIWAPN